MCASFYFNLFADSFLFPDITLVQGCVSITVVRTGSTTGGTGPTVFLVKSKNKGFIFTDKFLENHGLAPWSTIIMTPNAYMIDKAWVLVSKAIVESIQPNPLNAVNAYKSVTLSIMVQTDQLLV